MKLKDNKKIAALVKKATQAYLATKEYVVDLYRESLIALYGKTTPELTYLQVKDLHGQLKSLLKTAGWVDPTINSYLRACMRSVLFGADFEFAKSGSLLDVEKVQDKIRGYSNGTAKEKYERALRELRDEKRSSTASVFTVRGRAEGEEPKTYLRYLEDEISQYLGRPVSISVTASTKKRTTKAR